MTIKILIFPTINSLDYWFKYVKRYLVDECKVQAKTYKGKREIIVDNICLKFITSSESIRRYTRGLRDFETHYNLESKFENNFERTLYELLEVNNKETAGNLYIKRSYETLQDKIERLSKENYEKDIEINKLNNVIDRTTKYIEELTGSCPYDTFDCQVRDCDNECKDQMAECWKEYFMKE